ncbi:MAG: SDR family oxidoreductase [Verrucomicrobia bacterium]|jgi:2-hydroxycyclohexanecarboxyl-CoA dehydrogenase|nr:SDR family oxidoreductase [Verrucomicrobiota bacterium]
MDLGLKNQSVMIFGGAGTIGQAVVRQFMEEECHVTVFDSHPSTDAVVKEKYPGCLGIRSDVTNYKAVVEGFESAFEKFGKIDHVVFTVGVGSGKFGFPFWNLKPGDWSRVLNINLQGAVHIAHAFAPYAVRQKSGSISFFTSVAGQIGSQTDPPYSAAKAGLINFMQCVAKDMAPHHVRANAISPGMVASELNRSVWQAGQEFLPEEDRQEYQDWAEEKIHHISPLGGWQMPDEFGAMATYLASHHARHITGQVLNIDGGQVMHA